MLHKPLFPWFSSSKEVKVYKMEDENSGGLSMEVAKTAQNSAHSAGPDEKSCKIESCAEIVAKVGQKWARDGRTFKALTALAGPLIGSRNLKVVSFKGPWSRLYLPIFNVPETKQLLMWSKRMEAVVDLAKIVNRPCVPPTCYAGMLVLAAKEAPVKISDFCSGLVDEIGTIADFCYGASSCPIISTMVGETIARNWPEALVESGKRDS